MKILEVLAGAQHGGAETAFVDMCLAFHEAGETIEVVTRANEVRIPRLKEAGIPVHILPFGGGLDVYTLWGMTKIIKNFQPDIIQTWMSRGSAKTPHWKPSMNIPRYLVVPRLGGYYKLKYFKSADYFNVLTPDIGQYLLDNGVPEGQIHQINNFADTEEADTVLKRSDYDTPDDASLLLGLGRLHTAKAFDTLIKAVADLPDVYLWIAGEGPQREELETLIADLNVQSRVRLLGWRFDRAALFQAVDICVFSSRFEPFGTVFVQSWAQKTPLVTTASEGPRQFVRDGEDGLVVPVDDGEAIKKAVKRLIDNPELRNSLVENGYRRYQEEFTKDKTVQSYLEYFHDIRKRENL